MIEFSNILHIIEKFSQEYEILIYFVIAVSAFLENIIPILPGDTVIVFSAFLVGRNSLNLVGVFFSTTIGSFIGFIFLYYVGFFLGYKYIKKTKWKLFSEESLEKAKLKFNNYGYWFIIFNRFIPVLRTIVSITAGILKLRWYIVWILGLISCVIWNIILLYIGYIAGDNWENILSTFKKYNNILITIIVIVITFIIINKIKTKK